MPELLTPGQFGTDAQATPVSQEMVRRNRTGRRPLTPFERKNIEEGRLNPIYLYNVSPIHEWPRPQGQLGTITIPKRKWNEQVSVPALIPGVIVRWVRKGITSEEPFIEGGMDIAEDICGCSPRYDITHPNSNLTRYGVFISTRPFDVEYLPDEKRRKLGAASKVAGEQLLQEFLVPQHKQKEMIAEATVKLVDELQARILEADNWYQGSPEQRRYISQLHRDCLRAFNEITNKKESRPWATITMGDTMETCKWCGNVQKPGLPLCANCKNIINKAAHDAVKKEMGE
jgi:hypothetical protein